MVFTKVEGKTNAWDLSFTVNGGTVSTAEPIEAVFNSDGTLLSPETVNISIDWDDGSTSSIEMDISNMTQYAGGSGITKITQDGAPSGEFKSSSVDNDGIVYASYSNGKTYNIAKVALSSFTSPENLTPISGTLFEANGMTGNMEYVKNSQDYLRAQALEQSTANVETEFANMLVVQRAYSLNATSFTTSNEMLQIVVNLKT